MTRVLLWLVACLILVVPPSARNARSVQLLVPLFVKCQPRDPSPLRMDPPGFPVIPPPRRTTPSPTPAATPWEKRSPRYWWGVPRG